VNEDPRIALIEAAIDAFNAEDVPALLVLIHPDVTSRVADGLGNPGTFHGLEGYIAMMADWSEAWSENQIVLEGVELVDDSVALAVTKQTAVGAGSGVPLAFSTVFLIGFEGARAIRFEIHPDRDSALRDV